MNALSAITSINSLMAQRLIGQHSREIGAIMERLATGKRINHAQDDPAGLQAANRLDAEAASIKSELAGNDAEIHKLSVLDGHYSVLSDLAIDLVGVVHTAANRDALSESEREGLQTEADSIIKAMEHIYQTATFKGKRLFEGSLLLSSAGSTRVVEFAKFEDLGRTLVGNRASQTTPALTPPEASGSETNEAGATGGAVPPEDPDSAWGSLTDLLTGGRLNMFDGDLEGAAKVADAVQKGFASAWGAIGSQIKTLESRNRTLGAQLEGNRSAYSSIMDTDYAKETAALVRERVLRQASVFVLGKTLENHARTLALLRAA